MNIENVGRVKMVYAFFTQKLSANQLNTVGVCCCHAQ